MNEVFSFVLLILGLVAAGIVSRHLRNRQRLRLLEMAHQERVLALEKGIAPAELAGGPDPASWPDDAWPSRALESGWDRRIALGIGLVVAFASIGALLVAAFLPASGPDASEIKLASGLAIVPLMGAVGLLLYFRLTAPRSK